MDKVNSGGGAYVGNVNVGGDSVDRAVQGDEVHGDKVGGHKVNIGNTGGPVNVGNTTVQGPVSGTGIAIGAGARVSVGQGMSGDELARLLAPLRRAIQQADLLQEKRREAEGQAEAMAAEMSRPQPDGGRINERLMKLVMVGDTVAVAAMQLMQTPAIQALIRKAAGG